MKPGNVFGDAERANAWVGDWGSAARIEADGMAAGIANRPRRRMRSSSQVAPSADGDGTLADGRRSSQRSPRTPAGPSEVTSRRRPAAGSGWSAQKSAPVSSRTFCSRLSVPSRSRMAASSRVGAIGSCAVSTPRVTVVTDSTHCLPPQLTERSGIRQVSLYVGWGSDLRPEHSFQDLDAFYARLAESPQLPVTSQPSVGDFLSAYEPLVGARRDVVSIHIASGLSGTCESAREAARIAAEKGHPARIEVVDGQTGAGGLGCLVVVAADTAARGADLGAVVAAVRRAHETLDIWFCLDSLEYLRRGGRIGAARALVGSALQVKPILTFGTEVVPVGRVRTRRRAFERMVGYLHELHDRGATDWIVQHAQAREDAEQLVAEGTALCGSGPLFCTQVGPVLGAHLGSGMLVGGMTR